MVDYTYSKIRAAKIQLMQQSPFFGYLVTYLKYIEVDENNKYLPKDLIAAVDQNGNLYYGKKLLELTVPQICFILSHEVLHVALEHMDRCGVRIKELYNISSDSWINERLIKSGLQKPPLDIVLQDKLNKLFKINITDEMGVDERYDKLKPKVKIVEVPCMGFDNHIYDKSGQKSKVGEQAGEGAKEWAGRLQRATAIARQMGKTPGGFEKLFDDLAGKGKLPWNRILAKYLNNIIFSGDYSYRIPSRFTRIYDEYVTPIADNDKEVIVAIGIDSVASYSPVLVRNKEGLKILPISEIVKDEDFVNAGNHRQIAKTEFEIFKGSDGKNKKVFTKIKRIIRHTYKGNLIRINTHGGVIDISPNHSLITSRGKLLDASRAKVGDKLCLPADFVNYSQMSDRSSPFFFGGEDLAWLYGFFAADGSAYKYKNKHIVNATNNNMEYLRKAQHTMRKYFNSGAGPYINRSKKKLNKPVYRVEIYNKRIYKIFREKFYTNEGHKKIPDEMLYAPKNFRLAFLKGYDDGDGCQDKSKVRPFSSFGSNSQTLVLGLLWLIQNTTKLDYILFTRQDKDFITVNFSAKSIMDKQMIKKTFPIPYKGWVYDIEVEEDTHRFCSGAGLITVHNTSGSIDDSEYLEFIGEIAKMSRQFKNKIKLALTTCDAEVHDTLNENSKPEEVLKVLKKRRGYGGTNLTPAFDFFQKTLKKSKAIIFFSDLIATFPDHKPRIPVIWIVPPRSKQEKPPFGKVILMEN